ncbi:MAG: glycosyl transferase [Lachnospiraceae bacterium]|nr:glycosyl transferase [Lachnospiraceae bacterium]
MEIPFFKSIYILFTYICSVIPDELYLKLVYRIRTGGKLNLKNPQTFNEKLQWLKLHKRNDLYSIMVDKYRVRKYVADKIGKEYLIPLLGVYNNADDIDTKELPKEFVIKCTHDSGSVVLCKEGQGLTLEIRKKMNRALKRKYYYASREYPYKNVKPRIIVEQMMYNHDKDGLVDYKIHCFHGKARLILVCLDRDSSDGVKKVFYDEAWNKLDLKRPNTSNECHVERPKKLNEMIALAEELSKDIPFVRVDFYEINEKLYFGEMTFFPGGGMTPFEPREYDALLGSLINLDNL